MTGVIAAVTVEATSLFRENWQLLHKHYEWPQTFKQYRIFTSEVFKMENFRKAWKNRMQYALAIGGVDIAARLAVFRKLEGGWYKPFGSFEVNFFKKVPPALFAAAVTSWISVPFEYARAAYYADKTFPAELQKGYKSYFNALRRIPFEEGPYYLFKNCFPFMLRNFFQTYSAFFAFDWLKDKFGGSTTRISQFPWALSKAMICSVAVYFSVVFSYPWAVTVKEMVDMWPKENGVCRFDGSYRKAAVWLWYHEYGSNLFPGMFHNYFWKTGPLMFLTLWWADNFGMFTYWNHDFLWGAGTNSWEDSFS